MVLLKKDEQILMSGLFLLCYLSTSNVLDNDGKLELLVIISFNGACEGDSL